MEIEYIRRPFILRPERKGEHNWRGVLKALGESRGNPGWSNVFIPSMAGRAAELGIDNMSFDGNVGNSMDSHRLLHMAGLQSWEKQEALANELALSQFTRCECMGNHAVLRACALSAGVGTAADVDALLADPSKYHDDVEDGIAWAHSQGFYSIPVFILTRKSAADADADADADEDEDADADEDAGTSLAVDGARSPSDYAAVLAELAGGGSNSSEHGSVVDRVASIGNSC